MRVLIKSQCQRVSIKYSVICASLGLATAIFLVMLMVGVDGITGAFGRGIFQDPLLLAIVTLYASALVLGLIAGGLIHRAGVRGPKIWLMGIGLAWSCLFLSVFLGSFIDFLREWHNALSVGYAFMSWVIKPVFWVILVGSLPALGLGLLYATRVKKALNES